MILIHRITSFAVALIVLLTYAGILYTNLHPVFVACIGMLALILGLGRLLGWQVRTFQFWHLLGTPILFIASSFGVLFFLESLGLQIILGVGAAIMLALFTEHIFTYAHVPALYQPFSIEHLSHLMNILTVFFVASFGFGLRMFLQTPLWLLGIVFILIAIFVIYGTLWAGKVETTRARPYAIAGGVLTAQLFIALTYLPTGFYTNAAFMALTFYVFLGLTQANAHSRLSKQLFKRYISIFIILTLAIALTSQWL
jgi:hypothetical protein